MDFLGKTCPVCSENFHEGDDVVVCPKCGAPYHRECYKIKGKCIFTDLHTQGKSWHEVYDDDKTADEENTVVCPVCSASNDKNAIVCKSCGSFLSSQVSESIDGQSSQDQPQDDRDSFEKYFGSAGRPFAILLDPLGGVSKDESFDGVTAAELAKYVDTNTQYYLPVFGKIKAINKSKFNFSAFLFAGIWFLYRKQYVIGVIISLIFLLSEIASIFLVSAFSKPLFDEANRAMEITISTQSMTGYGQYVSWAYRNYSIAGVFWMLLPYLLIAVKLSLSVVSGLIANRCYMKSAIRKTKRAKEKNHDGDVMTAIAQAGGTNRAILWTFIACYIILTIAEMFV